MISTYSTDLEEAHVFDTDNYIYHIAIIDYLQDWNFNKKCERYIKLCKLGGNDGDKLSCIEPNAYAKRFLSFMEDYVFK